MELKEIDIWRCANMMVVLHGDDAPIQAAMKADKMLEAGDLDGKLVWLRIMRAAEQLVKKPNPDRLS